MTEHSLTVGEVLDKLVGLEGGAGCGRGFAGWRSSSWS
jgi:hypothetical protein